jgi:hypothetical protein
MKTSNNYTIFKNTKISGIVQFNFWILKMGRFEVQKCEIWSLRAKQRVCHLAQCLGINKTKEVRVTKLYFVNGPGK